MEYRKIGRWKDRYLFVLGGWTGVVYCTMGGRGVGEVGKMGDREGR